MNDTDLENQADQGRLSFNSLIGLASKAATAAETLSRAERSASTKRYATSLHRRYFCGGRQGGRRAATRYARSRATPTPPHRGVNPNALSPCGFVDLCRRGTERSSQVELIPWRKAAWKMMVGPSGSAGFQEQVPNESELLRSKAVVVSVGSKVPGATGAGGCPKAGRKRTLEDASITTKCRQNQGRSTPLG
jgi:hypothetical protein